VLETWGRLNQLEARSSRKKVDKWWPRIQKKAIANFEESFKCQWGHWPFLLMGENVTTPLLEECEDESHILEMGTWESTRIPETSEFNYKGQNTLPWGSFYIIGKLSKRKCWKWACMSHLKICSTSYGKKKGRKSNWQFDSWPLKVGNRPNPKACRWSVTHRWKALNESYKFALDLTPIASLSK
jgi:hypothetical protein